MYAYMYTHMHGSYICFRLMAPERVVAFPEERLTYCLVRAGLLQGPAVVLFVKFPGRWDDGRLH